MLTLAQAIKEKRIQEFIKQQEAAGAPPADLKAFEKMVRKAVKPPQSADRTSRSASRDDSSGT